LVRGIDSRHVALLSRLSIREKVLIFNASQTVWKDKTQADGALTLNIGFAIRWILRLGQDCFFPRVNFFVDCLRTGMETRLRSEILNTFDNYLRF
jgi:hypothetical protein